MQYNSVFTFFLSKDNYAILFSLEMKLSVGNISDEIRNECTQTFFVIYFYERRIAMTANAERYLKMFTTFFEDEVLEVTLF